MIYTDIREEARGKRETFEGTLYPYPKAVQTVVNHCEALTRFDDFPGEPETFVDIQLWSSCHFRKYVSAQSSRVGLRPQSMLRTLCGKR